MPARLRPTAPNAADAILVGDPGRALALAQELLRQPKMSHHARGLWGYTGDGPTGRPLTIQSTGMGGPSATVVLRDLAELGVRRAIRIGTGTSLSDPKLGELLIVTEAQAPGRAAAHPDRELTRGLEESLADASTGVVVSLDAPHDPERFLPPVLADVADMQTAALLAAGAQLGLPVAALLIVSERSDLGRLGDEELEEAAKQAGKTAAALLSS